MCDELRAAQRSGELFTEISPDLALLQEVAGIPDSILESYQVVMRPAAGKVRPQRFKTAILVRGNNRVEMVDVVRPLRLNEYFRKQNVEHNSEELCSMVRAYERTMQRQATNTNLKSFVRELVKQGKMKGKV